MAQTRPRVDPTGCHMTHCGWGHISTKENGRIMTWQITPHGKLWCCHINPNDILLLDTHQSSKSFNATWLTPIGPLHHHTFDNKAHGILRNVPHQHRIKLSNLDKSNGGMWHSSKAISAQINKVS
jgi:hypothetical protein